MMSQHWSPRLNYLDVETAERVLKNYIEDVPKVLDMIAAEPTKLLQTRYSSLARNYQAIAMFSYALGLPLATVRKAFSDAAQAYLKVFELRGTEPRLPVYNFKFDPAHPPSKIESSVEFNQIHDEEIDYSLTNSYRGYVATWEALVAGEDSVAEAIARLIWDPPDASYIGPHSFCTPNDQRLAYALRQMFHGTVDSMNAELDKLRIHKSDSNISHQATMLRAIAANDPDSFVDGLIALLDWHANKASAKTNYRNPEFFLCTIGLGISRLATKRQLCSINVLPQRNPFLPLELIKP